MVESRRWFCLAFIVGAVTSVNGLGLYKPGDNVTVFTADNIESTLSTSSSLWLVEYYLEWCGHCQNYVPTYKAFVNDVADWFPIVKLGSLNCADDLNNKYCTLQNITGVPALKLYTPNANLSCDGGEEMKSLRKIPLLRENLLKAVEKKMHTVLWNYKRPKPTFVSASYAYVVHFMRSKKRAKLYNYLALVFEKEASVLGKEIILDMSSCDNIVVRRVIVDSEDSLALQKKFGKAEHSSVLVIVRSGSSFFLTGYERTRHSFVAQLRNLKEIYHEKNNDHVAIHFPAHSSIQESPLHMNAVSSNQVYLADIESGLNYMFRMEIASNTIISGAKLEALKNLLEFFTDVGVHFPGQSTTRIFLSDLNAWARRQTVIVTGDWQKKINEINAYSYLPHTRNKWIGCRGSVPNLRRYPCSLWTIFHTLTVASYKANLDRRRFSEVMYDYITNFFGCLECRENFKKEIVALPYSYTNNKYDVILWLWKMHNKVNQRLHASSSSEDPQFPKLQFPPESLCPQCREAGTSKWKEEEVARYLIQRFSSESISWEEIDETNKIQEELKREEHLAMIEREDPAVRIEELLKFAPRGVRPLRRPHEVPSVMNSVDINLCMLIWLVSAVFVILLLIAVHGKNCIWRKIKPSRLSL